MKFPYATFMGKLLPIVTLELNRDNEWLSFEAYVDSGAGYSVFHSDFARMLDLKLEDGEVDYVKIGDGSEIKVYIHELNVRIAGEEFKARIGFSERLGIGFNIIGRLDIFWKFMICFNEKKGFVEFTPET